MVSKRFSDPYTQWRLSSSGNRRGPTPRASVAPRVGLTDPLGRDFNPLQRQSGPTQSPFPVSLGRVVRWQT